MSIMNVTAIAPNAVSTPVIVPDDPPASGDMTPEAILAVMARYATYPAGTPAPDEPEAKR
jgi:hypothetical protein